LDQKEDEIRELLVMQISVITVGKIKESFYTKAVEEYQKRLSKYCKLTLIEVADEKAPETLSQAQMRLILDKEGERILSKVKDTEYVITLEIDGKAISSEELASKLSDLAIGGRSSLTFIIGGSLGLSDAVKKRSDFAISFGKMTYPHQLMKVILTEQIYRAFRIIKNEPYHK
jgi:23S rRNA (pseudouridine1915-N3)-methyltransferase